MSARILRTALATSLVLPALTLAACGDDGSAEAEAPPIERPSAKPPVYHQTEYDMETGWTPETSDEKVGSYLESAWHDPGIASSKIVIDSRPAEGAPPPMMAAELARVQINRLPGYRERSLKRVKLGDQPAIRWAYDAAGEGHFAYFFERCGTSIVFRGSTKFISFEPFSEFYGVVASRVKPVCDE